MIDWFSSKHGLITYDLIWSSWGMSERYTISFTFHGMPYYHLSYLTCDMFIYLLIFVTLTVLAHAINSNNIVISGSMCDEIGMDCLRQIVMKMETSCIWCFLQWHLMTTQPLHVSEVGFGGISFLGFIYLSNMRNIIWQKFRRLSCCRVACNSIVCMIAIKLMVVHAAFVKGYCEKSIQ